MTWKRNLIPILLFTSTSTFTSDAAAGPPSDDDAQPELLELRGVMAEAGKAEALKAKPHYRPLCDAEGYPLVGNLLPKAPDDMTPFAPPPEPPYQPSEFCAEIRSDQSKA